MLTLNKQKSLSQVSTGHCWDPKDTAYAYKISVRVSVECAMPSGRQLVLIILTLVASGTYSCVRARLTIPNDGRNSTEFIYYSKIFTPLLSQLNSLELHLPSRADYEHALVQFLLRQRSCPLRLSSAKMPTGLNEVSHHHFRLLASLEELHNALAFVINLGGFYILALEQAPLDAELLLFMAAVWQRHRHNQIYYVMPRTLRTLLYNPFEQRIVLVQRPNDFARIFRNLNGYPLRCYIFDSVYSAVYGDEEERRVLSATGADAKVAEVLAEHLNFTLDYQWPDGQYFGARLDNGSFNGALGRVLRHELDIVVAGFFIKDYLTRLIEFTPSIYTDELCLFVQKAKRIPQSILPLFAVKLDVWLCFLLVGLICGFVWICIRRLNLCLQIRPIVKSGLRGGSYQKSDVRIFTDTWILWVRANLGKFPPFHSERIFLASLCLVSVIFGALLESSLATVYIRPLYYNDINTLAELDAANLGIYIKHPAIKDDLFYGHDSDVYRSLDKKILLVGDGEDRLINMIAQRGGFTAVTRAAGLLINDIRYIMTKRIHQIPECPKSYHIAFVLPRYSPYLSEVNAALLQLSAAGLITLWTQEQKERAKWSIHKYPDYLAQLDMSRWKVLKLTDVQLAFYALVCGCLLAKLLCLVELCWSCKYKLN